MSTIAECAEPVSPAAALPAWITFLLAASCGLMAANLYYAQPLVAPIAADLGLSPQVSGIVVTMTQIGYCLGLLLIVPLGDLVENRRLVLATLSLSALALLGAAVSTHPLPFLSAALLIGLGSVGVQILVPYAAHLSPPEMRGRVVGNVATGLMLGIMLSRPVSSLIVSFSSWHAVYFISAAAMLALALVLRATLPIRRPEVRISYGALLLSLVQLVRTTPLLRRRAFYQSCLFGAFNLFWTTTPLLLASPTYGLNQSGIALFAFAGVAGAIGAPVAGRLADRGHTRITTVFAMLLSAGAFLLTRVAEPGSTTALALLVVAALALDFGVQANVVLGTRALFMLGAEARGRLNGLYIAIFFVAGAAGSAIGAWAYAQGGWPLAAWIGFAAPVAALLYFATE
ncbi:Predicted arabinose efflux permease, MFS family [Enhydrobacter aerosaccus]|uniref:Predicted arabinose efflux permease, MFS family n=1 Tax=Enhydrobacter aerosaccus TaxID=225324 RepID=A0A1T4TG38_9HYPH|nr:MFS transporter [Enhydrobacter aerosaccus]SKA39402.1 Predicted arabinose efflux permease, MFS family [Enhydrobacter aerosaccus]